MTTSPQTTLSLNEVLAACRFDREALVEAIEQQDFPKPLPLGPWTNGWSRCAVEAWLEGRAKDPLRRPQSIRRRPVK